MAVRDDTFEVALKEGSTREELLEELEQAGWELVTDYEALPRNFCIAPPPGLSEDEELAQYSEFQHIVQEVLRGNDRIAVGASATLIRDSVINNPPIDLDSFAPYPTQGFSGTPYSAALGRNWGIARILQQGDPFPGGPGPVVVGVDWDMVGNGVDYYILDSGVDEDHPEFDEDVYGSRVVSVYDGEYEVNDDDQQHGTHMSTCGAGKNTGLAVATRVFSAKGLDGNNSGTTTALIAGMNALVSRYNTEKTASRRPGVMNNSWSSTSPTSFTTAVDAAVDAGLVMVASAGNSNADLDGSQQAFPAEYDDVISVGAIDIGDRRSSFSNFGVAGVDIWSPGRAILGGMRGGETAWLNGTSPAGALVTAVVCGFLQGYTAPTNRTQSLAVRSHVLAQGVNIQIDDTGESTDLLVQMPKRAINAPRITGLNNMVSPVNNTIRQASVNRQLTRAPGPRPTPTRAVAPELIPSRSEALNIFLPSPTAASTASVSNIDPWLALNEGVVDLDVTDTGTNPTGVQLLGQSDDLSAFTDGDGDTLEVPQREAEAPFAFVGSSSNANSQMYQTVPVRATVDSVPVSLHSFFTNLDFLSLTGWTSSGSGTAQALSVNSSFHPHTGSRFFEGTGGADVAVTQDQTLPASVDTTVIDAGGMLLHFECQIGTDNTATPSDQARVRVIALTAGDAVISTIFDTGVQSASTSVVGWGTPGRFSITDAVLPATTRKLRIIVDGIFGTGTAINCPVDSLFGLVYRDTQAGRRIAANIDEGAARFDLRYIARSFNVDSDDQGRSGLTMYSASGTELQAEQLETITSTHRWTTRYNRQAIPAQTRAVRVQFYQVRRQGTVINWYWRDITATVAFGTPAVSRDINKSVTTPPGGPTVVDAGFDPDAVTIIL